MSIVVGLTLIFAIGMIVWAKSMQSDTRDVSATGDSGVLSTNGLHWHPELAIYVKGVKQEIPNGLGLVGTHKPIHTHDDVPIVHLEYPARVTRDDTRLGTFFKVWGKDFREFGQTVAMTVNGEPSTAYENYEMKDKDKIELRYE